MACLDKWPAAALQNPDLATTRFAQATLSKMDSPEYSADVEQDATEARKEGLGPLAGLTVLSQRD
jgi:hypothetical protein